MCGSTPLHFSLPSHPPGALADAPGLCTIQILNYLTRCHNEVCMEIAAIGQEPTARGSQGGEQSFAVQAAAEAATVAQQQAALSVSAETPPELLRRRLIDYDRQRDLLPLLSEFSKQSLKLGFVSSLA